MFRYAKKHKLVKNLVNYIKKNNKPFVLGDFDLTKHILLKKYNYAKNIQQDFDEILVVFNDSYIVTKSGFNYSIKELAEKFFEKFKKKVKDIKILMIIGDDCYLDWFKIK